MLLKMRNIAISIISTYLYFYNNGITRDIGPSQNWLLGQKIKGGAYIFRNFKFKSSINYLQN